jgi:hypothetical protein
MRVFLVLLLALMAVPIAARADLHVNFKGTNPAKTWIFDRPTWRPYGGCSNLTCHGDGGFVFAQKTDLGHIPSPNDKYVYALECKVSIWKSGAKVTWHAQLYDNSNVCTLRWVNGNTIDVTIRN